MSFRFHPNHITSLAMHNLVDAVALIDGRWQPARPISFPTLLQRLRLAWWVFIGRADALTWPNQD